MKYKGKREIHQYHLPYDHKDYVWCIGWDLSHFQDILLIIKYRGWDDDGCRIIVIGHLSDSDDFEKFGRGDLIRTLERQQV